MIINDGTNIFVSGAFLRCFSIVQTYCNPFQESRYSFDIMRHTECLVFNPIMVEGYAALFSCTAVV